MRVLVLGAGFGGLELTTTLSEELGDDVEVMLIDQGRGLRLRLLEARRDVRADGAPTRCVHPYRDLVKPGVRFVQTTIRSIDPAARARRDRRRDRSTATSWSSRSAPTSTRRRRPAWSRAATSSTRWPARSPPRDVLAGFAGGRVVVGVTSTPFKCPPAPSETALLVHDFLDRAGPPRAVRDRARHAAAGPDPAVARRVEGASSRRSPSAASSGTRASSCASSTPRRKVARFADGTEMPFDLFLGVPMHRVPEVVAESGLCVDGWIPVDPLTLETPFPGRLRRRRRHQRRHAEGRRVRRGPGRGRRRRDHRAGPRAAAATGYDGRGHVLPGVRHARVSPRSTSPSSPGRRRSASSTARRPSWPPTRPTSAPPASAAGSAATGNSPRPAAIWSPCVSSGDLVTHILDIENVGDQIDPFAPDRDYCLWPSTPPDATMIV